jgi:hypothetical protein
MLNTLDFVLATVIGFAVMYVPTFIQMKKYGKL